MLCFGSWKTVYQDEKRNYSSNNKQDTIKKCEVKTIFSNRRFWKGLHVDQNNFFRNYDVAQYIQLA